MFKRERAWFISFKSSVGERTIFGDTILSSRSRMTIALIEEFRAHIKKDMFPAEWNAPVIINFFAEIKK